MKPEIDSTILIVDDEDDMVMLLRDALQRRGLRTAAVSSGIQCLEYLRGHVADVVVADIQMPGMSGIDLCRELSIRHPDLLVIVLTAVVGVESAVGAIRASAYDFITKPVKVDLLEICTCSTASSGSTIASSPRAITTAASPAPPMTGCGARRAARACS